jgi:penicillin-binding protein 1A
LRSHRYLALAAALLLFFSTVTLVGIAITFWVLSRDLPSADALRRYSPAQTTHILDRNGELIGEFFSERRTVVPLSRVPRVLVLSVLAAEDADFYHHGGMDVPSIARVVIKAVLSGKATQGGSTITQQVVKNLLLTPEKTLTRKLKELILAQRLEQNLSKDEILSLYLNDINFGHGRYGVQEASRYYFGKDVEALSLAEASLIAGIPQSPSFLSPRSHPEAARKRQAFVLDQLEQKRALYWDDLPLEEIERARKQLPKLAPVIDVSTRAPEVTQLAKLELIEAVGEDAARKGGFRVTTTVDLSLENAARKALQTGLSELDARHGRTAPFKEPIASAKELKKLETPSGSHKDARTGLRIGATYDAVVLGADGPNQLSLSINGVRARADLARLTRFNPKQLSAGAFARRGVRMRVSVLALPETGPVDVKPMLGPEGAVIVLDPRTREVLAMVGGYDAQVGFNRAHQALRQPGSTFKPIVYALGIKSRKLTPATMLIDAPGVFDQYKPGNFETWSYEGAVRLRHGVAQSINLVAVRVIDELGPDAAVSFAKQLGITSTLEPSLALALGSSEVRLSELTNAYATFAAGGRFAPFKVVQKALKNDGTPVKMPARGAPADVMSPAEVYVTTSLLTSVVEQGTGTRAKALGFPAAGKTGTSNQARDVWFIGYTTRRVAGVWIGFDDHRTLGSKESGGKSAVPIWVETMKAAHQDMQPEPFAMPSGVVSTLIDPASGKLAFEGQSDAIDEVFLEGTVPTEVARPPDVADPTTFIMEQLGGATL